MQMYSNVCQILKNITREQYGGSLKLNIELSHDSAIPFLGIYPEKTIIQRSRHPVFTVAPFIIAKAWKQLKCPSAVEQVERI